MKITMILLWIIIVFGMVSGNERSVSVSYTFDKPQLHKSSRSGFDYLTINSLPNFGNTGEPSLPVKKISILLPYGYAFSHVTVSGVKKRQYFNRMIIPEQEAVAISSPPRMAIFQKESSIYNSDTFFPENPVPNPTIMKQNGFSILSTLCYPIQYNPVLQVVEYYESMTVTVHVKREPRENILFRGLPSDFESVKNYIDNNAELTTYPKKMLSRQYDGLLITHEKLSTAFEELITWKKSIGLSLKKVLLQEIYSSASGRDNPEKIRNYIKEQYREKGIRFVILGGDVAMVPHRILYPSSFDNEDRRVACDLYYSCLDSNFNANGDEFFGENYRDEIDLLPELSVGRLPVETESEVKTVIKKIKQFESSPRSKNVTLHGAMMNDTNTSRDVKEGNVHTNDIGCRDYLPSDYNIVTLYQPDMEPTVDMFTKEWSRGLLFYNQCGHGMEKSYSIRRDNGLHKSFQSTNAVALRNEIHPIQASISCLTGRFDWEKDDCIAEKLLLNPNGGTVANVQNSRNGYYSYENTLKYSGELDIALYKHIFKEGKNHLGDAVGAARADYSALALKNQTYLRVVYAWNLLGDPTLGVLGTGNVLLVSLTSPNGGESLLHGTNHPIKWSATGGEGTRTITLEYSKTGKNGPWLPIADNEKDDGEYQWAVPMIQSQQCYVKVTVSSGGKESSTISATPFTIGDGTSLVNISSPMERPSLVNRNGKIILTGLLPHSGVVSLYDLKGRVIFKTMTKKAHVMTLPLFSHGIYFVRYESKGRVYLNKKIQF